MTTRKNTEEKQQSAVKPKTRRTKPKSKFIRNLRGTAFHMKLKTDYGDKEFRVQLGARGLRGDWKEIPIGYTEDPHFKRNLELGIFEIIPESEAKEVAYAPVGYQPRAEVKVVRNRDTVVSRQAINEQGMPTERARMEGPRYANAPGSDEAVVEENERRYGREVPRPPETNQEAMDAVMPPLPTRVTVTR